MESEPLLRATTVARRLGEDVRTIYEWANELRTKHPMPSYRPTGRNSLRFKWSEVQEWLLTSRRRAASEPGGAAQRVQGG